MTDSRALAKSPPQPVDLNLLIEDGDVGELQDALKRSPFSPTLKRLLWWEILDPGRAPPGLDGIMFSELRPTPDAETGKDVFVARLGRAGKAWTAALRALRPAADDVLSHDANRSVVGVATSR